jgi:hypothetical protein
VTLALWAGARGWTAALLIGCTVTTGAVTALLHAASSGNVEQGRQRASEEDEQHRRAR